LREISSEKYDSCNKNKGKNTGWGSVWGMKKQRKTLKKRTTVKEDFGKLLLDVGRLVTGSIVLGILLRGDIPDDILLIAGVAVAVVLYLVGLNLGKREIKAEKPEVYRRKRRKR
jgi:hypothetical protein